MRRWCVPFVLGSLFVIGLVYTTPSHEASAQSTSLPTDAASIERGRYLVHDVAMCVQCHSKRTDKGILAQRTLLRGGPVLVEGPQWSEDWAYQAPDLVALANGRPDYLIGVVTTGRRPDGTQPKSPMPPLRLSEEDARAVAAYIASLR